jgi:predicted O-methyltransferase YrrM
LYTPLQLTWKYLHYWLTASNGKGHGTHSPFVYDFIEAVLNDPGNIPQATAIEACRGQFKADGRLIEVDDFGAGSVQLKQKQRRVSDIARTSLKPVKYAQLLHRMVRHYQPKTILEIGTSLGITTQYLAVGNPNATVYTLEGSEQIAAIAEAGWQQNKLTNIRLKKGEFNSALPGLLNNLHSIDFAFIDGNHQYQPTLDYVELILAKATDQTILVLDDIHWSPAMEKAWKKLQAHPRVRISIDLFFIGILLINPAFKARQDFRIRY